MNSVLKEYIKEALRALAIEIDEVHLEHPTDLSHGDYASNVAMVCAKKAGLYPRELAEKIVGELKKVKDENIEKIEVAGSGFINFYLSRTFFTQSVRDILKTEHWGANENCKGKKVIVEYTQPNPFKPFHMGHLMSNALGESLSRLVQFSGADVFRANYQGDIGLHVAKAIWGIQKSNLDSHSVTELGKAYAQGAEAYEDNVDAKKEIDELNMRLYEKDPTLKDVYDAGRKTSLDHFEEIYKVLGTRFDHYFFESEVAPRGLDLVKGGIKEGVFEESEGAVVYRGEKHGLHTRVFITKNGIPTYEAKELGLVQSKAEVYPFDMNITVTATEQAEYFRVVISALEELLPKFKGHIKHVAHGMLRLPEGKMSSRTGNVFTGLRFIHYIKGLISDDKMKDSDIQNKDQVAEEVAIGAIKYSILKQSSGKNIIFDSVQALSFEGDSGPYLQYTHARALSVLRKGQVEGGDFTETPSHVASVERLLYRFREVVEHAQREYEPHYVTTYLVELASAFNAWYAKEKILDSGKEEAYKCALTQAVAKTLQRGLYLLGIKAPQEM